MPEWRQFAKDTAVWNLGKGQKLTTQELFASELDRSALYARVATFFEDYDALLLPAAQVAPFDGDVEWIDSINGETLSTYIDWMAICCVISILGLPTISVPAGFTAEGLPVGVQIVGKPRGDLSLLRIAHAFECATQHYLKLPGVCAES